MGEMPELLKLSQGLSVPPSRPRSLGNSAANVTVPAGQSSLRGRLASAIWKYGADAGDDSSIAASINALLEEVSTLEENASKSVAQQIADTMPPDLREAFTSDKTIPITADLIDRMVTLKLLRKAPDKRQARVQNRMNWERTDLGKSVLALLKGSN